MAPSNSNRVKGRVPRVTAGLLLWAILIWGLAAVYTLHINPELRHFKGTYEIKKRWAEKMTAEHGAKLVVYGGSSCEFSLDGERLLERHGIPCVNLGRGAGMGMVVLTMAALEEARPGDTLIVALEPGLITDEPGFPALGAQFSVAVGHADWLRQPLAPVAAASWAEILLALRPGAYHVFTMLGKLAGGKELYRYKLEEMRASGFNQTPVRVEIAGPPGHGVRIPAASRAFLISLRERCRERNIRLAYSLPWGYTPPEAVDSFQADNLAFLEQMKTIMPVLKDPRLGAYTVREHFADTAWHLTEEGSALRTDEFGDQVKRWMEEGLVLP